MSKSQHHCIREWAVLAAVPSDRPPHLIVYPWTSDLQAARDFFARDNVRKEWGSLEVVCREKIRVLTTIDEWAGGPETGQPR